jgi:membrane fusion protein (multidrug efflux system)
MTGLLTVGVRMMFRSTLLVCVFMAIVLTGCEQKVQGPPPAIPVSVITLEQRDVPVYSEWVGQTRGGEEVEIRSRVEGYIDRVVYQQGTYVRRGQVLYVIDPLQYAANVNVASGQLAEAEANLARAEQDVARYTPLVEQNAISRQEYETAVQMAKASRAAVQAMRGGVQKAQVELGYCTVTAPIDGLAGKTTVEVGDLVSRSTSVPMTTVSKLDPIRVNFSMSEVEWLRIVKKRRQQDAATKNQPIPLQLILADKSIHPYLGEASVIDNAIDPQTGTIMIVALFPNPEGIVRPGQFARVRASLEQARGAIVVPQRAISELQGTQYVAVVDPKSNAISMRPVVISHRVGATYVIEAGLKAGETIVYEGLQKVRDGATVAPKRVSVSIDSLLTRP